MDVRKTLDDSWSMLCGYLSARAALEDTGKTFLLIPVAGNASQRACRILRMRVGYSHTVTR